MAKKESCAFRTSIGGQALIEGILMRGPDKQAVVIRAERVLQVEIGARSLLKKISRIAGWETDQPRICVGDPIPQYQAVCFELEDAIAVDLPTSGSSPADPVLPAARPPFFPLLLRQLPDHHCRCYHGDPEADRVHDGRTFLQGLPDGVTVHGVRVGGDTFPPTRFTPAVSGCCPAVDGWRKRT